MHDVDDEDVGQKRRGTTTTWDNDVNEEGERRRA